MKEIKLTFSRDGKTVTKEVSGFEGAGCVNQTDFIEAALGKVETREFKSEYYIPDPVLDNQQAKLSI